jgi:hypothetical protein
MEGIEEIIWKIIEGIEIEGMVYREMITKLI